MIQYLIIALCIAGFLNGIYVNHNVYNPSSLFFGYWAIVISLTNLQLFGLYTVSQEAYGIIFAGLLAVALGIALSSILSVGRPASKLTFQPKSNLSEIEFSSSYQISHVLPTSIPAAGSLSKETNATLSLFRPSAGTIRLLYVANIAISIYCLYILQTLVSMLLEGATWWTLRLAAASGEEDLFGSGATYLIYNFIMAPCMYLLIAVVVPLTILSRCPRSLLVFTLVSSLLFSVVTASRNVWVFIIIYCALSLIIRQSWRRTHLYSLTRIFRTRRAILAVLLVIIVSVIMLLIITWLRNPDADLLANAYVYITGGIIVFDLQISSGPPNETLGGMYTLCGFLRPLFVVLHNLGIMDYPQAYLNALNLQASLETFVSISGNFSMNAYSTIFYSFWLDGGLMGVITGSFLFGLILQETYKRANRGNSTAAIALYMLLSQQIFFSVARAYTGLATRALAFVYLAFIREDKNKSRTPYARQKQQLYG